MLLSYFIVTILDEHLNGISLMNPVINFIVTILDEHRYTNTIFSPLCSLNEVGNNIYLYSTKNNELKYEKIVLTE